ncbi:MULTISPECIES: RNA polymerase sigma-70 factor [Pedobacter]|uniref:RNA polymerase sigma factor n=1 Tax=Pedobacter TaxID=84567 RepID=UPI0029304E8E|nr:MULTISPECIES: RNA polymerase sigma-70 factor [Pedobacter]
MAANDLWEESNWMASLAKGDESALSYFFKLHQKSLGYFASRMIGDEAEAEDIVAGCFVKLWERRSDFENAHKLKSFLYVSCRNACLNHLRHLKVKSAAQQAYHQELEDSSEDILYKIVESEVLQAMHREIELLPENYREVFKRIYFEQQKTDEIALELGINVQTVRNYKTRSVELLKTALLKKGISSALTLALLLLDRRL